MHLFYQPDSTRHFLEDEEARHCAKVLRVRRGDEIEVTDGHGTLIRATVQEVGAKQVFFKIGETQQITLPEYRIHMAICPTRKSERNEWMVEKMTELGVHKIQFIVSEHTHRETIGRVLNFERLHKIALSAMKQSQQYTLPELTIFSNLEDYLSQVRVPDRYIAYVAPENSPLHLLQQVSSHRPVEILIGPEGDFSKDEIEASLARGFKPVSLGPNRLRTETAAVAACHSAILAQIL
jgi:16S rRNA (uracil1498-N3)-methyltransferase